MSNLSEIGYGFGKKVPLPYVEAVARTKVALKEQGFGILSEIYMRDTMREKLGVDFKPYLILGACNPPLAYQALTAEQNIGLLLPCNVIIYEEGEGSVVMVLDPVVVLGIAGVEALTSVAQAVKERLQQALENLPG